LGSTFTVDTVAGRLCGRVSVSVLVDEGVSAGGKDSVCKGLLRVEEGGIGVIHLLAGLLRSLLRPRRVSGRGRGVQ